MTKRGNFKRAFCDAPDVAYREAAVGLPERFAICGPRLKLNAFRKQRNERQALG